MHSSAPLQTGESPEARPIPFFYKPGGKIILGQEADAQIANEVATWKTKAVRVICSNKCFVDILGYCPSHQYQRGPIAKFGSIQGRCESGRECSEMNVRVGREFWKVHGIHVEGDCRVEKGCGLCVELLVDGKKTKIETFLRKC